MLCSIAYGCLKGCCEAAPVTRGAHFPRDLSGSKIAAALDVVISALAIGLIFLLPKLGVNVPPMGQYALLAFGLASFLIVGAKQIVSADARLAQG